MLWFLIALSGYFLLAFVATVDKILLSGKIQNPTAYVFYLSTLGMLALLAAPFGFHLPPSFGVGTAAVVSGFLFAAALFFFFKALFKEEASRIVPLVGGATPIIILGLSTYFLQETLSVWQLTGFGLLVVGGVALSMKKYRGHERLLKQANTALTAAALFAISAVLIKYAYDADGFINGFLWARFGGFAFALMLLVPPSQRNAIFAAPGRAGFKTDFAYLTNAILGAIASILIQYAISLGSVSLVNAMQGAEYAFLFLLLAALSKRHPHLLHEQLEGQPLTRKLFGLLFVAGGLIAFALGT